MVFSLALQQKVGPSDPGQANSTSIYSPQLPCKVDGRQGKQNDPHLAG